MADRPPITPRWATDPGARIEPTSGRKDTGFIAGDAPGAGEHNFLMGNQADWIEYLDQSFSAMRRTWLDPRGLPELTGTQLLNVGIQDDPGGTGQKLIMAGDDNEIFYSYDGQNWNAAAGAALTNIQRRTLQRDLFRDAPNERIIVAHGSGVGFRADIRASGWVTKALPAGTPSGPMFFDNNQGVGFVKSNTAENTIYGFSNLNQASPFFAPATPPPTGGGAISGFARSEPAGIWVCMIEDDVAGDKIYRSANTGNTWAAASSAPSGAGIASINDGLIWLPGGGADRQGRFYLLLWVAGTGSRLWEGTSDGNTWTDVSSRLPDVWQDENYAFTSLKPLGGSVALALGKFETGAGHQGDGTLITFDGGNTWETMGLRDSAASPDIGFDAVVFDGRIYAVGSLSSDEAIWKTVAY